jgi:alpha-ketoglutarate-dependent taurine dioxygenase
VSTEGLEPGESKAILEYLYDVYERNLDIQIRFWRPTVEGLGTSALWDNRVSQHCAVWDYAGEEPRHGTKVSSLAEIPFLTRAQSLKGKLRERKSPE